MKDIGESKEEEKNIPGQERSPGGGQSESNCRRGSIWFRIDIDIDNTEDQEEILTEREKLEERRKNRLKKNKMIRVREEFIYEEDLTEKEREDLKRKEYRYKSNHVGLKIVEAILIPSKRVRNNEVNKSKILRYTFAKKYN